MLEKETFTKYMNEIIKQYDTIDELYDDFTRLFGNFEGIVSEVMSVSLPINILSEAMEDTDQWIEYFVYECDCGRTGRMRVQNESGDYIPFETVEDLWKVLTTTILEQ